jgi:ribokinase
VGDDLFGRDMIANLRDEGINVDYLGVTGEAASGVAVITIDATGMNQIIVTAGANALLSAADVERAVSAIQAADVLVCQLEVPHAATLAAMRLARAANKLVILNPAPISEPVPAEFYPLCDILCPNEHEATLLTGQPVATLEEAEAAARTLLARGPQHVILTLGERGSLLVNESTVLPVSAPHVTAVDTTGAGDAFVGSLAFLLASKMELPAAIERANQIAAISVQRAGAQTSYPRADELPTN